MFLPRDNIHEGGETMGMGLALAFALPVLMICAVLSTGGRPDVFFAKNGPLLLIIGAPIGVIAVAIIAVKVLTDRRWWMILFLMGLAVCAPGYYLIYHHPRDLPQWLFVLGDILVAFLLCARALRNWFFLRRYG